MATVPDIRSKVQIRFIYRNNILPEGETGVGQMKKKNKIRKRREGCYIMVKRKGTICVKALRQECSWHIQETDIRPVWADLAERGEKL